MSIKLDAVKDYPLYEKRPELIKTQTGKNVDDITVASILSGAITPEDCRISPETLEYQAQIQESYGNPAVAANFRRAAEMTKIPDDKIIHIYNCLRPNICTKEELIGIAEDLENNYGAVINGALIREAAQVHEKSGLLKK